MLVKQTIWIVIDTLVIGAILAAGIRLEMRITKLSPLQKGAPLLQPGSVLSAHDIVWAPHKSAVLLMIQRDCVAAQQSVPFYRKLVEQLSRINNFQFIVASPDSPASTQQWLHANDLRADLIAQITDGPAAGLYLSPTLVVLDEHRTVQSILGARLNAQEESSLLSTLGSVASPTLSNVPDEIPEREYESLNKRTNADVEVIDGRKPFAYHLSHRRGSVNIPFDELPGRTHDLVTSNRRIILDCPSEIAGACPGEGTYLRQRGVKRVSLLFSGLANR